MIDGQLNPAIHNGLMKTYCRTSRRWKLIAQIFLLVKANFFWGEFSPNLDFFCEYFTGDAHGTDGPMNIDSNRFAPLKDEWLEVGEELGYKVKDPNGAGQKEGFFPMAFTMKNGTRFSTQRAYIYPVLRRPNLTIRTYSTATKVCYFNSFTSEWNFFFFLIFLDSFSLNSIMPIVCLE